MELTEWHTNATPLTPIDLWDQPTHSKYSTMLINAKLRSSPLPYEKDPPFKQLPFKFKSSKEAAQFNSTILDRHNNDFTATLNSTAPGTKLSYGFEFYPCVNLESICNLNPLWEWACKIISHECDIPMYNISEEEARQDLLLGIK